MLIPFGDIALIALIFTSSIGAEYGAHQGSNSLLYLTSQQSSFLHFLYQLRCLSHGLLDHLSYSICSSYDVLLTTIYVR